MEIACIDQEACRLTKSEYGICAVDGVSESKIPPKKLKYQNVSGMILARAFSEAIHCTKKRIENRSCAAKPTESQISSVVGVVSHQ